MPQRVTARPQEFFEIRSVDARLNSRRARYVVDFEHLVQTIEIDRHRGVARLRHIDAPHDRCAAARWNDDVTVAIAPRERCFEFRFRARMCDGIGRRRKITAQCLQQFERMPAVRVHDALVFIRGDPRLQLARNLDARRAQLDVGKRRDRRRFDASRYALRPARRELAAIGVTRFIALETPRPETASTLHRTLRWLPADLRAGIIPAPLRHAARAPTGRTSPQPTRPRTPCPEPARAPHAAARTR